MNLNPVAVSLWVFLTCIGFLIGGTFTSAVAGLAVGVAISILSEIAYLYLK